MFLIRLAPLINEIANILCQINLLFEISFYILSRSQSNRKFGMERCKDTLVDVLLCPFANDLSRLEFVGVQHDASVERLWLGACRAKLIKLALLSKNYKATLSLIFIYSQAYMKTDKE